MQQLLAACRDELARGGRVVALTGAGVSAESGIVDHLVGRIPEG